MKLFPSPMARVMGLTLGLSLAGWLLFALLHRLWPSPALLAAAITLGTVTYHMAIRFLSPVVIGLIFRRRYDPEHPWFRPRSWEPALYRRLRVKQWKGRMASYDPSEFSLACHTVEEIAANMCHAELVHELIILLSLASAALAVPFGEPAVFTVTALLAAGFDSLFVILQRCNRPRLLALAKKHPHRRKETS